MRIQFLGGVRTVTGSMHRLEVNGSNVLLDGGLFQGRRAESYQRNSHFTFDPASIDALVLSHAHIDHSGNIPTLAREGLKCAIFATAATRDLCAAMLRDSAYIQEQDAAFVNRKRARRGEAPIEPLYTVADAMAAVRCFTGLSYWRSFTPAAGVQATFLDAGHILGAALTVLDLSEGKRRLRVCYSGDLGRRGQPILRDPEIPRDVEVLIIESTYGNRLHSSYADVEEELAQTIRDVAAGGGKVIIPSFAVGRTQHLVYVLHKLFDQDRIPDMPVYVDSPLAVSATEIYRLHPDGFNDEVYQTLFDKQNPFGFDKLTLVRSVDGSKALNELEGTAIIISASGMCEAGRILHHLKNHIGDPKTTVLFVGYCAEHTLGRRIRDGDDEVAILGGRYKVRAAIEAVDSFSGHADHSELLDYFERIDGPKKRVWLVHGEPDAANSLHDALEKRFGVNAEVAELGHGVEF